MSLPPEYTFLQNYRHAWSRRTFLGKSAQAIGSLALGSLLNPRLLGGPASDERWRGILPAPHFLPRAKRVVHLCMAGGPSHVDLFDPKPELNRLHGQPFPESFTRGQQLAQLQGATLVARGSPVSFRRCGLSGQWISDGYGRNDPRSSQTARRAGRSVPRPCRCRYRRQGPSRPLCLTVPSSVSQVRLSPS